MRAAHIFCLVTISLFIGQARGQTPSALDLAKAVDAALENHPAVRSARLGVEFSENRSAEARAERMPKIRISETLTRGNNPVFVFGSLLEQARFGPQNFALPSLNNPASVTNLRSVLSASLPLFDGKRTSARIAQSNIAVEQALRQEQIAEQRVRFEVIGHYFGMLVAEGAAGVAGEAVRMAESDTKRAQDRLDAGLAVESDVLAAQVQLAEFKQQRIQAAGDAATALAVLNIAIGSRSNVQRTLTTQLSKKHFEVASPDDLVVRAMQRRPDYQLAESGIDAADRRTLERRSEYFPEFNAFAYFGSSGRNLTTGSTDYSVGATATFTILDRSRSARADQALVDKRLAQTERDRVADQIRVEAVRAYNRFRAAEEQVEVAEGAMSQASEGLRIVQNRYEAGLTTITDVLRAETAMVRTRLNVLRSRYDHYLSYAAVLLSIGDLNDVKAFEPGS
jgi:outer membrane protein TolC